MLKLASLFLMLLSTGLYAQSPYLSIEVKMDRYMTEQTNYRISMKVCEPLKMTNRGDWFAKDTSRIDYLNLKSSDFSCGNYNFIEGPSNSVTYPGTQFNLYQFANQVFAWEKVLIFRIGNYSSPVNVPEMFIVLPMKYKSFVTKVELSDVPFESGKVVYLSDPSASYSKDGSRLTIEQSLRNPSLLPVDSFVLKEMMIKRYQ